jgi:hypothetical protein
LNSELILWEWDMAGSAQIVNTVLAQMLVLVFLYNKSEHQVSRETGVPQRTIHDRKIKILAKLKRLMNE